MITCIIWWELVNVANCLITCKSQPEICQSASFLNIQHDQEILQFNNSRKSSAAWRQGAFKISYQLLQYFDELFKTVSFLVKCWYHQQRCYLAATSAFVLLGPGIVHSLESWLPRMKLSQLNRRAAFKTMLHCWLCLSGANLIIWLINSNFWWNVSSLVSSSSTVLIIIQQGFNRDHRHLPSNLWVLNIN